MNYWTILEKLMPILDFGGFAIKWIYTEMFSTNNKIYGEIRSPFLIPLWPKRFSKMPFGKTKKTSSPNTFNNPVCPFS